jgi:hypothetical protein
MSKTYELVTEESAAEGDAEDRGFEYEDNEFDTLWEMANEIRDGGGGFQASDSRRPPPPGTWYSSEPTQDQHTGGWTSYSWHPDGLTKEETARLDELIRMSADEFDDIWDSEEFMSAEESEPQRGYEDDQTLELPLKEQEPKKGATMRNLKQAIKLMGQEEADVAEVDMEYWLQKVMPLVRAGLLGAVKKAGVGKLRGRGTVDRRKSSDRYGAVDFLVDAVSREPLHVAISKGHMYKDDDEWDITMWWTYSRGTHNSYAELTGNAQRDAQAILEDLPLMLQDMANFAKPLDKEEAPAEGAESDSLPNEDAEEE